MIAIVYIIVLLLCFFLAALMMELSTETQYITLSALFTALTFMFFILAAVVMLAGLGELVNYTERCQSDSMSIAACEIIK